MVHPHHLCALLSWPLSLIPNLAGPPTYLLLLSQAGESCPVCKKRSQKLRNLKWTAKASLALGPQQNLPPPPRPSRAPLQAGRIGGTLWQAQGSGFNQREVGGGRGGGAWAGRWRLLGVLSLLHPRGASSEMAARSLGSGVGRLLRGLHGRSGQSVWSLSVAGSTATRLLGSVPAIAQPGSYPALSAQAAQEPAAFWGPLARDILVWDTPFHTVWDCDFRTGKIGWFLGGQLNVSGEWVVGDQLSPSETPPEARVSSSCSHVLTPFLQNASLPTLILCHFTLFCIPPAPETAASGAVAMRPNLQRCLKRETNLSSLTLEWLTLSPIPDFNLGDPQRGRLKIYKPIWASVETAIAPRAQAFPLRGP